MPLSLAENNKNDNSIIAVRIYLAFTKEKDRINIQQDSKHLDGNSFLKRGRNVRKPGERHMKIALNGTIQTTINYYKKHLKKQVTHIGIYLSSPLALSILEETIKPNCKKNDINLIIIEKDLYQNK